MRWGFEVAVSKTANRYIIFTNPTAGPWKLVQFTTKEVNYELHRFRRDEERPDVVVICDIKKRIYVIEAKERPGDLDARTIEKTYQIASRLAGVFGSFDKHSDWKVRQDYAVVTGFLFGAASESVALKDVQKLNADIEKSGRESGTPYICAVICEDNKLSFVESGIDSLLVV